MPMPSHYELMQRGQMGFGPYARRGAADLSRHAAGDPPPLGSMLQPEPGTGAPMTMPPPQPPQPFMGGNPSATPPAPPPQAAPPMNFASGGNPFADRAARMGFSDFDGPPANYGNRASIMNATPEPAMGSGMARRGPPAAAPTPPDRYRSLDTRGGRGNLMNMQAQALRGGRNG